MVGLEAFEWLVVSHTQIESMVCGRNEVGEMSARQLGLIRAPYRYRLELLRAKQARILLWHK